MEDNIKMNPKEVGINTRNLVDSAQDMDFWRALVHASLDLKVPEAMELVFREETFRKALAYMGGQF